MHPNLKVLLILVLIKKRPKDRENRNDKNVVSVSADEENLIELFRASAVFDLMTTILYENNFLSNRYFS